MCKVVRNNVIIIISRGVCSLWPESAGCACAVFDWNILCLMHVWCAAYRSEHPLVWSLNIDICISRCSIIIFSTSMTEFDSNYTKISWHYTTNICCNTLQRIPFVDCLSQGVTVLRRHNVTLMFSFYGRKFYIN